MLRRLAAERILVLDGAMGTMIQALGLDEEGYRGARFDAWNREVRGNNDLLNLSRPDSVRAIHLAYFRAGADIVSTNTFSSTRIAQADYGMAEIAYELNAEGARLAREAARIAEDEDGRPALRRRRHRADQPHRLDLAGRVQSRLPRHHVRRTAHRLQRTNSRPDRSAASISCSSKPFSTRSTPKPPSTPLPKIAEERGVHLPVMISGTITDRSGRLLAGRRPRHSGIRSRTPRR